MWSDSSTSFIQRIDADYCKITSVCDGSFLYSVDMSKLRGKLEYYPAEFSQMYQQYLSDGQKWQEVPPNISFCVKGDSSMLDCTVPVFAATMPALYTIANVESLQETATQLKNYKMIAGEIPTDSKGNPLMDAPMVKEYYAHIANALGENVGLALAPFELKSLSFSEEGGVANVDDLSKAVASFWSTAGTSGLLHGRENDTAGVTKLAIKNDETFMLDLVQQYERLINRFLKTTISGTNKFKVVILPITAFNKDEYIDHYKAAAALGIGKSMYVSINSVRVIASKRTLLICEPSPSTAISKGEASTMYLSCVIAFTALTKSATQEASMMGSPSAVVGIRKYNIGLSMCSILILISSQVAC